MKRRLSYAIRLVAVGIFALAGQPVMGQTTANGPYYATPSWDQKLPSSTRFIVLANWNSEAVLDRETGLVWQRRPQVRSNTQTQASAITTCWSIETGGRRGWRLPHVNELQSLADPANSANSSLPAGHPFQEVFFGSITHPITHQIVPNSSATYWSADPLPFEDSQALITFQHLAGTGINSNSFLNGGPGSTAAGVWCVRAGEQ